MNSVAVMMLVNFVSWKVCHPTWKGLRFRFPCLSSKYSFLQDALFSSGSLPVQHFWTQCFTLAVISYLTFLPSRIIYKVYGIAFWFHSVIFLFRKFQGLSNSCKLLWLAGNSPSAVLPLTQPHLLLLLLTLISNTLSFLHSLSICAWSYLTDSSL